MPTAPESDWLRDWVARTPGVTVNGVPAARLVETRKPARPRELVLVEAAAEMTTAGAVFVVPCEVPSLSNSRDWRVRNRVAQAHRRAVSRALGPKLTWLAPLAFHLHDRGGAVRCRLTRLGGRKLDPTANLPASLKYVEDGACLLLGIDDADPRWVCTCHQEPGGSAAVGVRVELSAVRGGSEA